jgi:hypothetical protein
MFSWFAYNTGRESRITEQDLTVQDYSRFVDSVLLTTLISTLVTRGLLTLYSSTVLPHQAPNFRWRLFINGLANLAS